MSINTSQTTAPVASIAPTQELRARTQGQEIPTVTTAIAGDKTDVTLSTLTQKIQNDDSRDVDYARVAEMRAALASDELYIKPEEIAKALVQDIFQF